MAETWDEQVMSKIISRKDLSITEIKDFDAFIHIFFDRERYDSIVSYIKIEDWESIKSISQAIPDFREDLVIAKFTNQDNRECLATIYDSD